MDRRIKTKGNPLGGYAYRQGGWSQYSRPIKLDKKLEDVKETPVNKQIKDDNKKVDDTKIQKTSIDTVDRENREDNKQLLPKEE
jgi:hypothetical protein